MVLNAIQFSADECDSACRLLHAPFERLAQGVYTVTVANGSGSGTLYAAIQQANAFGNGGTINIQDGLGTIDVGQLPDITVGLTINGGFGNTLSGQNQNRIFFVNAPGQAVQIDNMTLANGFAREATEALVEVREVAEVAWGCSVHQLRQCQLFVRRLYE